MMPEKLVTKRLRNSYGGRRDRYGGDAILEVTDRNRKQREIIIDDHCDT
jgi:hypothetical protein